MVICFTESLAEYFRKYGEIENSYIAREKHTRMPKGYAFVTFFDPAVFDKVLEQDDHVIDGREVMPTIEIVVDFFSPALGIFD